MASIRRFATGPAVAVLDVLSPVHAVWWAVFGVPLLAFMHGTVGFLAAFPVTLAIGPFGLAVIATTLLVRFVLLPLSAYQVRASLRARREAAEVDERLAPAIARLRRRYRGRPLEFQRALLELRRREGIDPLAGAGAALRGSLLPTLAQMPVLVALYWVILTFAHTGHDLHFLWVVSLAVPDPIVLPVLAGLATFALTQLTNASLPPAAGDDAQTAASRRAGALLSPLVLIAFAHFAPAALALYWLTGGMVATAQQWFVNRYVLRVSGSPA